MGDTKQQRLIATVELHTPDALLDNLQTVNARDISDVGVFNVLLYSGDAGSGGEYFTAIADAKINEKIFDALSKSEPGAEIGPAHTWRFDALSETEFLQALGLAFADVAAGTLQEVELHIMILLETGGDETLQNRAIFRVLDGHYLTLVLRVKRCQLQTES